MTEKRFRVFKVDNMYGVSDDSAQYTVAWDNSQLIMDNLCDLLNEQDQKIKELENIIQKLVIELFKPPCPNNDDKYEVLNKFLNEELNIRCIEVDINVEEE